MLPCDGGVEGDAVPLKLVMQRGYTMNKHRFATLSLALLLVMLTAETAGATSETPPRQYNGRYRARSGIASGSFSGVFGTVGVADPVLRQGPPEFSAMQLVMVFPRDYYGNLQWIEAGWSKESGANNCDPRLYWAVNPGWAQFVAPALVGRQYRITIALVSDLGYYRVRMVDSTTNQVVFLREDVRTAVPYVRATSIQANGENGLSNTSDMGISGLLDLKYRVNPGDGWPNWPSASYSNADIPYWITRINSYTFQVGGNQGNPGYYCQ